MSTFPIDLGAYQRISLDPSVPTLTAEQKAALQANIQLCRDAIVVFYIHGCSAWRGRPYWRPLRHRARSHDYGCFVPWF